MGRPRLITAGNSYALTVPKPVVRVLDIDRTTEFTINLEGDWIVYKPHRQARQQEPKQSSPVGTAQHYAQLQRMMGSLDAHGLSKAHFKALSHDGMELGEFAGSITCREEVDPITVERLRTCLERREACSPRERWETTIAAALEATPSTDEHVLDTEPFERPFELEDPSEPTDGP